MRMLKIGITVGSKQIARMHANNNLRKQGVKQKGGKHECKHVEKQGENQGGKLRVSQKASKKARKLAIKFKECVQLRKQSSKLITGRKDAQMFIRKVCKNASD